MFCAAPSRLLALAVLVALGACDGSDNPLAPTSEPPAPADESVATVEALAAVTAPRIAFASYRNGNDDIYLMDPQGYHVTRLTTSSAFEGSPAWSWDNKRIAMVRPRKDASNVTHYDIYVINADGTNGHWARSTPSPFNLADPCWSPDGSNLLFTMTVQGVQTLGWLHLATGTLGAQSNGSGGAVQGHHPSYDPTGQRIVYVGSSSKSLDLINADGSGHLTLVTAPGPTISGPVFSPDGKRIVFGNVAGNGDYEIFVRNADGSVKRLTNSAGTDLWPSWSPDGSKIAFGSTRNGRLQIWSMSSTGGSATRLSHNSYTERTPVWSH